MVLSGNLDNKFFIAGLGIKNHNYTRWEIEEGNLYLYYDDDGERRETITNDEIKKINIGTNDDDLNDALDVLKEQKGGKRKTRRNRKSKKGKKSRKARKSRRKSNRRRGRR